MSHHVLSVCIFCFICATHSPCASHAAVRSENLMQKKHYHDPASLPNLESNKERKLKHVQPDPAEEDDFLNNNHRIVTRDSDISNNSVTNSDNNSNNTDEYVKKIFSMYGDGVTMTIEGFEKLMGHLSLQGLTLNEERHFHHGDLGNGTNTLQGSNNTCVNKQGLTSLIKSQTDAEQINNTQFYKACPVLLYSILAQNCIDQATEIEEPTTASSNGLIWLCSIVAVVVISACGVLALAIIPVMQKKFYKPLIQFLVALAVGTLAGDALLHLLPHAMSSSHHSHHHGADHSHDENTQKGCVAMLGLTFFFIMERLISLIGKWRKGKQKQKHSHVTVIKDRRESMNPKNNTQCMEKYNPIPFCYSDIMSNPHTIYESDRTATTVLDSGSNSDVNSCRKSRSPTMEKLEANQNMIECSGDMNVNAAESKKMLVPVPEHKHEDYTVILREHKSDHHGHSHKHGHVHAAPQNFSSVAWMVIMGDGLHNFTDGMAIGAAFSGGLAGGFSTTVAVFCHELPHELGDFAMLLKAGMSIKQALFYNILSSILCIFGNIFGLALGNTEYASSWVFAAAAGMFIYIALVDMIPELSSAHEDEGNLMQCVLHLSGLLVGFGVMALIAFYEHDLMHIFHEDD